MFNMRISTSHSRSAHTRLSGRLGPPQATDSRRHLARERAGPAARRGPRGGACCASTVLKASPTAAVTLPQPLRDATAILTSASGSPVYLLGVSHVSKESCRQIEELIRLVQPDVVLVELCKDRVPLLVNPDDPPPTTWYSNRVAITGVAPSRGWPDTKQLAAGLACRGGAPVSASEIEDDAVGLLSTGLFASVQLAVKQPIPTAAPAFVVDGSRLRTVAPVGGVEFVVRERVLPKLTGLEVKLEVGDAASLADDVAQVTAAALQAAAAGTPAVRCYLQAREGLLGLFPEGERSQLEVVFSNVESGNAQAVVRRVAEGQRCSLTGLEGSAAKGQGWGIEPFQRRAKQPQQSVRLAINMQVDAAPSSTAGPSGAQTGDASGGSTRPQVQWRPWTDTELQRGAADASSAANSGLGGGMSGAFATAITQAYAKFQLQAGRRVGIAPGAAWQTALRAAAACGAQQVLLGDRPANTTAQRLADGIWAKCSPFLLGSVPAAAASAVIVASSLHAGPLTPLAAGAAAALPVAAAAWPIAAPLLEIAKFGGMSAAEIEESVRVKEPVQAASPSAPIIKLWGEDALLDWPGAMEPIIHERDLYMAKAMAAAANGVPQGLTPAFISTLGADGRRVLRYAMPQGGSSAVCPAGAGDGVYQGLPAGRTVVAVVGTAHVRGMIRVWPQAQVDADLSAFV